MLNVQDNPPYVHRHEDTLSFNLFHHGVFWIDSPGSYSVGGGGKVQAVKGHANQSVAFDPSAGFRETSRVTRCDWDSNSFAVSAVTPGEGPPLIERTIRFELDAEELVIIDRHCSGGSVVSQYLLAPKTIVNVNEAVGCSLEHQDQHLRLLSRSTIQVAEGLISFARHQIEKTTMLRLSGVKNEVRIPIMNDLGSLVVYRTSHPYLKRKASTRAWEYRIAARLHTSRLRQLSLLLAIVTIVLIFVALIVPSV
jgi:hypothetical protein